MPLDNDWLMGDPIYPCALCDLTPFVLAGIVGNLGGMRAMLKCTLFPHGFSFP